jgi:hypothetical protein
VPPRPWPAQAARWNRRAPQDSGRRRCRAAAGRPCVVSRPGSLRRSGPGSCIGGPGFSPRGSAGRHRPARSRPSHGRARPGCPRSVGTGRERLVLDDGTRTHLLENLHLRVFVAPRSLWFWRGGRLRHIGRLAEGRVLLTGSEKPLWSDIGSDQGCLLLAARTTPVPIIRIRIGASCHVGPRRRAARRWCCGSGTSGPRETWSPPPRHYCGVRLIGGHRWFSLSTGAWVAAGRAYLRP